MLVGGLRLLVRRCGVAVDAGETGIFGGHLVAIIADRTVMRNREIGVVKGRTQPGCGGVTGIAGCRVTSGKVVWHRPAQGLRAGPSSQMAAVAGGVRCCQRIVVIHVAIGAADDFRSSRGRHLVCARQCPPGGAVIKFSIHPGGRVMAGGAQGSWERSSYVVWHGSPERLRAGPIRGVATVADGVRAGEVVIVVDVAQRAGRCGVGPGQSETGHAMVKGSIVPADRRMAIRAICNGKCRAGTGVDRIVGLLPSGEVAAGVPAIGRRNLQVVVVVEVTT